MHLRPFSQCNETLLSQLFKAAESWNLGDLKTLGQHLIDEGKEFVGKSSASIGGSIMSQLGLPGRIG